MSEFYSLLEKAFEENYPGIEDAEKRKELFQFFLAGPACLLSEMKCLNCRHWRDKAWTDKGWGICDNPQNETRVSMRGMITNYMRTVADPEKEKMIEELVMAVDGGIRYPEDFGCTFFESNQ